MSTETVTASGLSETGLRIVRGLAGGRMRRRWEVNERGQGHVPAEGPVILASNHIGWLDGPLMITAGPRAAHALVKQEMFEGRTGALLRFMGQISVRRGERDAGAVRAARRALAAGQAVVVYPETTRGAGTLEHVAPGAAYLALATGAPIVPVAMFGTRAAGRPADWRPPKGSRIEVVYGAPVQLPRQDWPRSSADVAQATEEVATALRWHVEESLRRSSVGLPGPLPEGEARE